MINLKDVTGKSQANQMLSNADGKKKDSKKKLLYILLGVAAVAGIAYFIYKSRKTTGGGESILEEGTETVIAEVIEAPEIPVPPVVVAPAGD